MFKKRFVKGASILFLSAYSLLLVGCLQSNVEEDVESGQAEEEIVETVSPVLASEFVSSNLPSVMAPGEKYDVVISLKNTSNIEWLYGSKFRLGMVGDGLEFGLNRVDLPYDVSSGETVEFKFTLIAPLEEGIYSENMQMLKELEAWFGDVIPFNVEVSG